MCVSSTLSLAATSASDPSIPKPRKTLGNKCSNPRALPEPLRTSQRGVVERSCRCWKVGAWCGVTLISWEGEEEGIAALSWLGEGGQSVRLPVPSPPASPLLLLLVLLRLLLLSHHLATHALAPSTEPYLSSTCHSVPPWTWNPVERPPVELLCWFVLCDQKRIPALRNAPGNRTETSVAALNCSDVCLDDPPRLVNSP